jgi:drug/metabolite transporter (DMT)-like permease
MGVVVVIALAFIMGTETKYFWGYFYGIIAALLATLFTLFNAKYINKVGAAKITMIEMLSGVLIISCILFFQQDYTVFTTKISITDLTYLIILGTLCTAMVFVWLTEIMRHITPYSLIMAINLEPVYSIIFALIIFGDNELMSSSFYFGSCVIIGIVFLDGYLKNKQ